jgi:membrane fusion protein (multidrug efflux system)
MSDSLTMDTQRDAFDEAAEGPAPSVAERQQRDVERNEASEPHRAEETTKAQKPAPAKNGNRKKRILMVLGAVAAVALVAFGLHYWLVGQYLISTDDAYVGADFSIIAPKVSGYVEKVVAKENHRVKAGDVLVQLDPEDYRIALQSAEAKVATQRATIDRLSSQIDAAAAAVKQSEARLNSAQAELQRTQADFDRYQTLSNSNYASRQQFESARAARDKATAGVTEAQAGIASAKANLEVAQSQKIEAERTLAELNSARDSAQRDLDATTIRAPFNGVVGNRAVAEGDYVTPGKRLLAVVPLDDVYVNANFKETQIAELTPGTAVHIEVDAYPALDIVGHVDSLSPASGAVFSLLPPENATGNFTKIVQRLPVRVRVPADVAREGILRPGLSVVATADLREKPEPPPAARQ